MSLWREGRWRGLVRSAYRGLPAGAGDRLRRLVGVYNSWEDGFDFEPGTPDAPLVAGAPDFVGIGAQRCGTSWWHSLIEDHPSVYRHGPFHKERQYFRQHWIGGAERLQTEQYHRWFPRPPGRLSGEWSPDYLLWQWVAPHLRAGAPEARLIVLVRDPVERYRSGVRHGLPHFSPNPHRPLLHEARWADPELPVEAYLRGFYAKQLRRYERVFPDGQILVLQYERCRDDPGPEIARTYRHLGIDDTYEPLGLHLGFSATRPLVLPEGETANLVDSYTPDVMQLVARYPDIDLGRWPNFAHLQ